MRGEILQFLGLVGLAVGLWGYDWRISAVVVGCVVGLLGYFDRAGADEKALSRKDAKTPREATATTKSLGKSEGEKQLRWLAWARRFLAWLPWRHRDGAVVRGAGS